MVPYSARRQLVRRAVGFGLWLGLFLAAAALCDLSPAILKQGLGKAPQFTREFFPPLWAAADEMVEPLLSTLALASAASLLGMLLAFPVGLAAAANIVPMWLRLPVRILLGAERALPEILQLLFFVVAFGLGPFSGMCALAFSSIGMLGKLVGDAIEDADDKVLESLKATGASFWQVIRYGLLPQVLPSLAANALFRFDVNVRSSVVLGAIGAGGIGAEIARSMGMLQYNRATMAVLGSLILIYAAETVSGQLRRRLLEDGRS
jgi:phosphonate transport system permease protein